MRDMLHRVVEACEEFLSVVFNFITGLFTMPVRTLYKPASAFSRFWYKQVQERYMSLFPLDKRGISYGTTVCFWGVFLVSIFLLSKPWARVEFYNPHLNRMMAFGPLILLPAGLIAWLEIISNFLNGYLEVLGDPFSVIFSWLVTFFRTPAVSASLGTAASSMLQDFGVLSLGLGFLVKCIVSLGTWIHATIHIPIPWMITLKTAILGVGRVIQIFDLISEINGIFEHFPNIPVFKSKDSKICGLDYSWFTEFIHETTNDYYEWYIWERLLRVRTGRPGEEPIEVKELKKGENKGHKIVLGGSRLDCRIFGIHFKSYAPVLANANLKLWSWFCQAYGSGQILTF